MLTVLEHRELIHAYTVALYADDRGYGGHFAVIAYRLCPGQQLEAMLGFVREGDTVVVHSMNRLARNLDDLRRLVQQLTKRGVRIEFLKEGLVFTGEDSPMANLMLSVMGAFAEFERALIRERQREGIASSYLIGLVY